MLKVKSAMRRVAFGVSGAALAFAWLTAAPAADPKSAGRTPIPTVKIEKSGNCVEPTDKMRRDHMNMILHQRDRTVHNGIRSAKHSLKGCIDCHADSKTNSVLGPDGFCQSCHSYSAVRMDCFECHSPSPRKAANSQQPAASRQQSMPDSMHRAIIAATPAVILAEACVP